MMHINNKGVILREKMRDINTNYKNILVDMENICLMFIKKNHMEFF